LRLIRPHGGENLLDHDLPRLSALALTPDEKWLSVASEDSRWGYIYRVESDYSATHRQKFYWFHIPDAAGKPGPSAWVTDSDGRLYASTGLGVQVLDRNGRVRAILPVPGGVALDLTFGGADFGTLFVLTADKRIYRRRLNVRGVKPGERPIKLPDGNGA
jgi:sugar lactone lactonase YvrE